MISPRPIGFEAEQPSKRRRPHHTTLRALHLSALHFALTFILDPIGISTAVHTALIPRHQVLSTIYQVLCIPGYIHLYRVGNFTLVGTPDRLTPAGTCGSGSQWRQG